LEKTVKVQHDIIKDLKQKWAYTSGAASELRKMVAKLQAELTASEKDKEEHLVARNVFYEDLGKASEELRTRTRERDLAERRWTDLRSAVRKISRVLSGGACEFAPESEGKPQACVVDSPRDPSLTNSAVIRKGQVVAVHKSSRVKFAAVLEDTRVMSEGSVPILFLEEIDATDVRRLQAGSDGTTRDVRLMDHPPCGRNVIYLAHVSKVPTRVAVGRLIRDERHVQVIEWKEGDIWDQMADGSFYKVHPAEYMGRQESGVAPEGLRATLFLIDRSLQEILTRLGGCGDGKAAKRSSPWPGIAERKKARKAAEDVKIVLQ
jgi:hypothetical protein